MILSTSSATSFVATALDTPAENHDTVNILNLPIGFAERENPLEPAVQADG
jgi:hypothetical protein